MATTRQMREAMTPAGMARRIEELEQRIARLEAQSQRSPAKKTAAPKK